jgi:four helix bundle protein
MQNAKWQMQNNCVASTLRAPAGGMCSGTSVPTKKPFDIHERLFLFACDVVNAAQILQTKGSVGRALAYQLTESSTSAGANAEESDAASSHRDFIAKNRIALREAKETRFRLRVCRKCRLLNATYDPLIDESEQLVRILATIVFNALRNEPEPTRNRR